MSNSTDTILWTALITPMKENGDLHLEDLSALIRRQHKAGNGVLILGSTGEGLALSLEDKKIVVETASAVDTGGPLMVGVGGFNLQEKLEWIEYCRQFNIDAFLLVTPLYAKPGPHGQFQWFKTLLDAADKPCMLYNVPSRTGVKMAPLVLEQLGDHPNLMGVKEASGSIEEYQNYRKMVPDLPFYSGDDGLTPFFAMAGCNGLVSVASNVWPEQTHRYVEKCLKGHGPELLPLWKECSDVLFEAPNPIPVKVLLKENKVITTATLRPPLTTEEVEDIDALKKADDRIQRWYREEDS